MSAPLAALCVAFALGAEPAAESPVALSLRSAGALSLTPAKTQGGVGGGVGVFMPLARGLAVEADVAWLWGLGSHVLVRAGAAWQRDGRWRPLVRADLEVGLGGSLEFSVRGRLPPRVPTLGVTLGLGLLRFEVQGVAVSALELSAGVATDFVGVGPRFGVTLLGLAVPLEW